MAQYASSAEFTNDLDEMVDHLKKALEILQKPEFGDWMSKTDKNYGFANATEFQHGHLNLVQKVCLVELDAIRFQTDLYNLDA